MSGLEVFVGLMYATNIITGLYLLFRPVPETYWISKALLWAFMLSAVIGIFVAIILLSQRNIAGFLVGLGLFLATVSIIYFNKKINNILTTSKPSRQYESVPGTLHSLPPGMVESAPGHLRELRKRGPPSPPPREVGEPLKSQRPSPPPSRLFQRPSPPSSRPSVESYLGKPRPPPSRIEQRRFVPKNLILK